MTLSFDVAAGSDLGKDHRRTYRNNQDAYCITRDDSSLIAVVCDGCGSHPFSEVGAQLGARLITQSLASQMPRYLKHAAAASPNSVVPFPFWERTRQDVLAQIRLLANNMGSSFSQIIESFFLFSVVGTLITPYGAHFFSIGDGIIAINEEVITLGPFPGNAPPYLAYGLGSSTASDENKFCIHRSVPTKEVATFLIGSDGVLDLVKSASLTLPGKTALVGPLNQFWTENKFFANPEMINRRLRLINDEGCSLNFAEQRLERWYGRLSDDTTLIVGRQHQGDE